MPRQELVANSVWDELDDLSNDAMLLYLWSFTNPRCGVAGLYRLPKRKLSDGRLEAEALDDALAELTAAGLLRYEDGVLWVVARTSRWRTHSPQSAKSALGDLKEIGSDHPLAVAWLERYGGEGWLSPHLPKGRGNAGVTVGSESGSNKPFSQGLSDPSPRVSTSSSTSTSASSAGSTSLATCVRVLGEVAEIRGAGFPDTARVARAIEENPGADPVAAARDFREWACEGDGKTSRLADVVDGFRRQLGFTRTRPPAGAAKAEAVDAKIRRLRAEGAAA